MADLSELTGLAPGSAVLLLARGAAGGAAAELRAAGHQVTEAAVPGPGISPVFPEGAYAAAVLDEILDAGSDVESILAEVVHAVSPGGLVVIRIREGAAAPTREELCAHFAGELLGVEEHAEGPGEDATGPRTTWLLRVPGVEEAPGGDR